MTRPDAYSRVLASLVAEGTRHGVPRGAEPAARIEPRLPPRSPRPRRIPPSGRRLPPMENTSDDRNGLYAGVPARPDRNRLYAGVPARPPVAADRFR
jgi:hypothetical protein